MVTKVTEWQNVSKASTGLRTIAARLRNTTTDLEELGEEMTEAKYEEVVSALTNAGVSLRDMNGEYRSTYDIMSDIAAKWNDLTSMQKAALATNIAGTRQQNVFFSIIEQFNEASNAMDAMTKSEGALAEANESYMDSIPGKLAKLQAAFQEFSQSIIQSKFFKTVIDWLTKLLGILQAIATFGNGFLPKLAATLLSSHLILAVITRIITKVTALYTALKSAGSMTEILKKGLTSLSNHLVVAAISAVVITIKEMADASKRAAEYLGNVKKETEDVEKTLDELASVYKTTKSDIETLNTRLQETNSDIARLLSKGKLTIIEQAELTRLQTTNDELERQLVLKKKLLSQQQLEAADKFVSEMETYGDPPAAEQVSAWENFWDKIYAGWYNSTRPQDRQGAQELINRAWSADTPFNNWWQNLWGKNVGNGAIEVGELSDQLFFALRRMENAREGGYSIADRDMDIAVKELATLQSKKEALSDIDYDLLPKDAQEALTEIEKYESWFTSLAGTAEETESVLLGSKHLGAANEMLRDAAQTEELTAEAVKNLANAHPEIQQLIDEYRERFNLESEDDAIQGVIEHYNALIQGSTEGVDVAAVKFEELKSSLDSMRSAFSTVSSAIKEFNENGYMSSDTLSKLLELEPEYLNLLVDENGQLNLNSESYEQLIKAKLQNMLLNQMDSTIESIMKMGVEEAAAYAAAEAYDAETDSIYELIAAKMRLALSDAKDKDAANGTDVYTKAIMRMGRTFEPMAVMIDNYSLASENAASSTNKSTSATKANTEALEAQKSALEAQKKSLEDSKKALEDYKNELSDAQSDIRELTDLVQEYIKAQKDEEKKSLQERKENFDDLIAKEKEELQVKKEAAEFEKTLREKQNTVAKDALAASIASLDNSSAGRKSQKETADALINSRGDLQETLADHEYDIRVKALDELQKKNDEYYDKQIEKIDEYLSNTRQIYEDACRMIENDTGDLYGKLWEYTYQHTTQTKAEFDNMWSSAQEALQRYGADQYGVIGVMEFLQGEIYNTERDIDSLSDEIDNLAVDINDVSGAISALNSEVKNAANDGISNLATQIGNVRDEYEKMMQALQQEANKKWHFSYDGIDYWSTATDFDTAASQIWKEVYKRTKLDINRGYIMGGMHYYANGTNSAPGGLAVVGERGAELEVMNRGNGVLTNKITRGLAALGSNPAQFIADASAKLLNSMRQTNRALVPAVAGVNGNQSVPINFSYVINGDVNPQTLRELKKYHQQTVKEAVNTMMSKTLGWRNSSRVR